MGQCWSRTTKFFDTNADTDGDGKFTKKDVEIIGHKVYAGLVSCINLIKLFSPVLQSFGVDTSKLDLVVSEFDQALNLSQDVIKLIEKIGVPGNISKFSELDLKKIGDYNKDNKCDIEDIIDYANDIKTTLSRVVNMIKTDGKDPSSVENAIEKINNVIAALKSIQMQQQVNAASLAQA